MGLHTAGLIHGREHKLAICFALLREAPGADKLIHVALGSHALADVLLDVVAGGILLNEAEIVANQSAGHVELSNRASVSCYAMFRRWNKLTGPTLSLPVPYTEPSGFKVSVNVENPLSFKFVQAVYLHKSRPSAL